jgi:hypothetical protein
MNVLTKTCVCKEPLCIFYVRIFVFAFQAAKNYRAHSTSSHVTFDCVFFLFYISGSRKLQSTLHKRHTAKKFSLSRGGQTKGREPPATEREGTG